MAVLIVVIAGGATTAAVLSGSGGGPAFPSSWDPRVKPLAAEAAKLRHLSFEHPVEVTFLDAAAYRKAATDQSPEDAEERRQLTDAAGEFRALGLVQGSLDLKKQFNALNGGDTDAFYSFEDHKIYVRGTKLTPEVKVTLVHELTHVLQDQHFGIDATYKRIDAHPQADDTAFQTLIEGDATSVENAYVSQLSPAQRRLYTQESDADAKQANTAIAKVPAVLADSFSAPYVLGPIFVKILQDTGGEHAVDDAFRTPPVSFLGIWNPVLYLQHVTTPKIPEVPLPKGATKIVRTAMGPFDAYLTLAERIPAVTALDAADAWRGDRMLVSRQHGKVCVDLRARGDTGADDDTIAAAFDAWSKKMPPGTATVTRVGAVDDVLIHTCDPGVKADLHVTGQGDAAMAYPVVRAQFAEQMLEENEDPENPTFSPGAAFCLGNDAVHQIPMSVLTSDSGSLTSAQQDLLNRDALACVRANP